MLAWAVSGIDLNRPYQQPQLKRSSTQSKSVSVAAASSDAPRSAPWKPTMRGIMNESNFCWFSAMFIALSHAIDADSMLRTRLDSIQLGVDESNLDLIFGWSGIDQAWFALVTQLQLPLQEDPLPPPPLPPPQTTRSIAVNPRLNPVRLAKLRAKNEPTKQDVKVETSQQIKDMACAGALRAACDAGLKSVDPDITFTFVTNRQQDTSEGLGMLMSRVQSKIDKKNREVLPIPLPWLRRHTQITWRSRFQCVACTAFYTTDVDEHIALYYIGFPVYVDKMITMQEMIDHSRLSEKTQDTKCRFCNRAGGISKSACILNAPHMLIVSANRWKNTMLGSGFSRTTKHTAGIDNSASIKWEYFPVGHDRPSIATYTLCAAIIQTGNSIHGGHYIALIGPDPWYTYDDDDVALTYEPDTRLREAFIYFYKRVD